jgi:MFS family permease
LLVAGTATSLAFLTVGGALHALATSLITPSGMAIAMEGSSPERHGASIATYSLGYQLGIGVGGLAWGAAIDAVGFSWTYLLALCGPIAIAAVAVRARRLARRRS